MIQKSRIFSQRHKTLIIYLPGKAYCINRNMLQSIRLNAERICTCRSDKKTNTTPVILGSQFSASARVAILHQSVLQRYFLLVDRRIRKNWKMLHMLHEIHAHYSNNRIGRFFYRFK